MAASPLSVVLKGGWPHLDCVRLCTKAVKWVEKGETHKRREREGGLCKVWRHCMVSWPAEHYCLLVFTHPL